MGEGDGGDESGLVRGGPPGERGRSRVEGGGIAPAAILFFLRWRSLPWRELSTATPVSGARHRALPAVVAARKGARVMEGGGVREARAVCLPGVGVVPRVPVVLIRQSVYGEVSVRGFGPCGGAFKFHVSERERCIPTLSCAFLCTFFLRVCPVL